MLIYVNENNFSVCRQMEKIQQLQYTSLLCFPTGGFESGRHLLLYSTGAFFSDMTFSSLHRSTTSIHVKECELIKLSFCVSLTQLESFHLHRELAKV